MTALAVLVGGGLAGLAVWLFPVSGDLTRVGWYSENRYGFHKPREWVRDPLYTVGPGYDRYHDILILGDSFSVATEFGWPNWVAARGYSVRVAAFKLVDAGALDRIISSPAFRETPPKVFIYASAERLLKERLGFRSDGCDEASRSPPFDLPAVGPRAVETQVLPLPWQRRFDENQITYARDFFLAIFRRWLARGWHAADLALTTPRFSSRASRRVLVLSEDIDKGEWNAADLAAIRCGLLDVRRRVESNGVTRFVFAAIPDKLSAYHDDLVDRSAPASVLPAILGPPVHAARIDLEVRRAIEAGEVDVYLPDDTHWGDAGQRAAARAVLAALDGGP